MLAKISLVAMLIVSLLFCAQARPVAATMPECAAVKCERGCCSGTACCGQQEQAPQPAPIRASERAGDDVAALGLAASLFLYVLRPVEAKLTAAQDAAIPHALPRLAVSCIRLI